MCLRVVCSTVPTCTSTISSLSECVWTVSGVCCWRLTFSGHFAKAETEDVSDVFLYLYHSKQHMYVYNQTAFCSIH